MKYYRKRKVGRIEGLNTANMTAKSQAETKDPKLEGLKEEKKQLHSAMERKYRQELNSYIGELRGMVPLCFGATSLNKVEVLKRTGEYIAAMQRQEQISRIKKRVAAIRNSQIPLVYLDYNRNVNNDPTNEIHLSLLKEYQRLITEQQRIIFDLRHDIAIIERPQNVLILFFSFLYFY